MGRRKKIWKDIIYKNVRLSVSQDGSVRHKGKLKERYDCGGYWYISCEAKKLPIHHLVAKAFCKDYKYKCVPNHLDCNKHNNYFMNLKCGTHKENVQHAHRMGLVKRGKELWKGITKKFIYND